MDYYLLRNYFKIKKGVEFYTICHKLFADVDNFTEFCKKLKQRNKKLKRQNNYFFLAFNFLE